MYMDYERGILRAYAVSSSYLYMYNTTGGNSEPSKKEVSWPK